MVEKGDIIELTENAIDNYGEKYKGKKCKVTYVSHGGRGYDEGMSPQVLVDTDCKGLGALYEYEFFIVKKKK